MDTQPPTSLREVQPAPDGWFDALPEEHQRRIVAEDEANLRRWEELERRAGLGWRRPAVQGSLLFAVVATLLTAPSPAAIACGALCGAVAGWLWHRTDAGQLSAPLIAIPLFLLSLVLARQLNLFCLILGTPMIFVPSHMLGMRRHELPGS